MIDEAEAKLTRPLSSNSMALSCSTSEYIFKSLKGESIKAMQHGVRDGANARLQQGCNEADKRPTFTSWRKNSSRCPAMALVSASGGNTLEGLSAFR